MVSDVPCLQTVLLAGMCVPVLGDQVLAYIGPGAGFAVGTAVATIFVAFLSSVAAFFLWPIRWLLRLLRARRAHARARVRRVVILGLDGMEPSLADRYMADGKLPCPLASLWHNPLSLLIAADSIMLKATLSSIN